MPPPSVEPLPLYRPRDPRASDLWRLMDRHFETFRRVYDERFAPKYGFWRPIVERSVTAFLGCGDLHEGFARVRCGDCGHEMFEEVTCGAFTAEGKFLELPAFDIERLESAWREAVFALYLGEGKIEAEAVENMRGWEHSGFSVDQSVFLPAGDRAGIERLVQYMTRCPFSLSRLVKVTETGQVVYKAEKDACRRFPGWKKGDCTNFRVSENGTVPLAVIDELAPGPKRNFQVLDPLDFLAEFTQHIPPKGAHLIRYYGWYSNKSRGMRRKAIIQATTKAWGLPPISVTRCSQTWAMLIKRVYEVDPLACPKCGGQMKVVAFIEPPQGAVIEKILRHCGLWQPSTPRPPPAEGHGMPFRGSPWRSVSEDFSDAPVETFDQSSGSDDWTYVDIDTFEAGF